jgi:hypothetical protein
LVPALPCVASWKMKINGFLVDSGLTDLSVNIMALRS